MTDTTLAKAGDQTADLGARIKQLAEQHPDWTVEHNQLRNWSIMDADGNQVGHIDALWGELEVYDDD